MELNGRRRGVIYVIGYALLQLCMLSSANVIFQVHHKFAGSKRSLAAFKAHDSHRHRRFLSAIDLPIGGDGSPTSTALYFTKIQIGTPPKDYHVQVDTGSDILWVNCAGCGQCPKKSNLGIPLSLYNPKESSTANLVTCDQEFCTSTYTSPSSECKVGMLCSYFVTYGDGSSTSGYFVKDDVQFDRVSGNLQTSSMNGTIAFGCGDKQSGELGSSQQALDGILGFGQANSSMISQLASTKKVKKMFSHCLDGSRGGGIFAIGEVVQPKVKTTRMIPQGAHYNVELKAIEVGGDVLRLPTDIFDTGARRGTIIDSGTTLAYLPNEVYNQLMEKIMAAQPNMKTHTVDQQFTCYNYRGNVDNGFPIVIFYFQNALSLKVHPHQYLFEVEDQEWCIGFQNSGSQSKDGKELTLLGDLVLTDKLITYDMENQTIGWTEYNCSSSIRVRDEVTSRVYVVGAHDISSSGRTCHATTIFPSFLFLIPSFHWVSSLLFLFGSFSF